MLPVKAAIFRDQRSSWGDVLMIRDRHVRNRVAMPSAVLSPMVCALWNLTNPLFSLRSGGKAAGSNRNKTHLLCMRRPARVELVGVIIVCHPCSQEKPYGIEGEEDASQHDIGVLVSLLDLIVWMLSDLQMKPDQCSFTGCLCLTYIYTFSQTSLAIGLQSMTDAEPEQLLLRACLKPSPVTAGFQAKLCCTASLRNMSVGLAGRHVLSTFGSDVSSLSVCGYSAN